MTTRITPPSISPVFLGHTRIVGGWPPWERVGVAVESPQVAVPEGCCLGRLLSRQVIGGSADVLMPAADVLMHTTGLWQCEAAAARPGAGSMFAKAVVVCCIMYRAAVVVFQLPSRSASLLKKSLGTYLFRSGDSLQGLVFEISQ